MVRYTHFSVFMLILYGIGIIAGLRSYFPMFLIVWVIGMAMISTGL